MNNTSATTITALKTEIILVERVNRFSVANMYGKQSHWVSRLQFYLNFFFSYCCWALWIWRQENATNIAKIKNKFCIIRKRSLIFFFIVMCRTSCSPKESKNTIYNCMIGHRARPFTLRETGRWPRCILHVTSFSLSQDT